ncbi:PfaD family polyunsaturated fatty acid/polyketide biosynthesis protein [Anaerolinea thermophila]|nr:PfaD family polyunsaturated fatty acid/polyketide biosynthesis protein [Anaerolinea thermophila]
MTHSSLQHAPSDLSSPDLTKTLKSYLESLDTSFWIYPVSGTWKLGTFPFPSELSNTPLIYVPAVLPETFGDPNFKKTYGVKLAYYAGAMANAIASERLVITMGKAGLLASFGAGGCSPNRIENAIHEIQKALPKGPYAFNLLNSPNEPSLERRAVELYLKYGVPVIEASAYLDITYPLALYRLSGLSRTPDGKVRISNHIIAKVSRKEVASRFLSPAPADLVSQLLSEGKISEEQAQLASLVPMADDITVEADSGGHTDNRPLVGLIPTMLALRDEYQAKYHYETPVHIGAAGGISTPQSVLAAFMMGAAYVVTGSVNQSCVESGASEHTRNLLAQADMADVAMAPAADMFEMGVKVQVLKRGTMFANRASKLYELYSRYPCWEEVPQQERTRLETTVFKRTFEEIWQDTEKFFAERDPRQLERAQQDPHHKMALVFRWYLGLSSRWSNTGEKGREMDYQIWCGPAMGTFNDWVRGTYLEKPENRHVVDVALHLMKGAAYLARVRLAEIQGINIPHPLKKYVPETPLV